MASSYEVNFTESLKEFKASRIAPSSSSTLNNLSQTTPTQTTTTTTTTRIWNTLFPSSSFSKPSSAPLADIESQQSLLPSFLNRTSTHTSVQRSCFKPLTTAQRFIAFACCFGGGSLCFSLAFFMLPMIVISPHKFALLSCMGSLMFFSSIGFLRGWSGHLQTVFHRDRWPFTLLYMGSFLGGLFCSIVVPGCFILLT